MPASDELGRPAGPALLLDLECHLASVRRVAAQIRTFLLAHGLTERDVWACEFAFVEGCNNAIQNTPAANAGEPLVVEVAWHNSHLELRIKDHTAGYDFPDEARLPAADEESGRGIYLMRSLMDEVDYIRNSSSNCLVLKKALTGI